MLNCETAKELGLVGVTRWCRCEEWTWCQVIEQELEKLQETIAEVEALEVE